MEKCTICGASHPVRKMDEDGLCPACHTIAKQAGDRIKAGKLLSPESSSRLEKGQEIPRDAAPAKPDTACDVCDQPLGKDQHPYSTKGRDFFVHSRCWEILLTQ